MHGYFENPSVESVRVIVDAYLERNDCNLIILDWGDLADGNYAFDAVVNLKQVSTQYISRYVSSHICMWLVPMRISGKEEYSLYILQFQNINTILKELQIFKVGSFSSLHFFFKHRKVIRYSKRKQCRLSVYQYN